MSPSQSTVIKVPKAHSIQISNAIVSRLSYTPAVTGTVCFFLRNGWFVTRKYRYHGPLLNVSDHDKTVMHKNAEFKVENFDI